MGHIRAHNNDCPHLVEDQPNPAHTISNNIFEFWRLNHPSFDGGLDPIVAEAWIMQIEKLFMILELTEEQ